MFPCRNRRVPLVRRECKRVCLPSVQRPFEQRRAVLRNPKPENPVLRYRNRNAVGDLSAVERQRLRNDVPESQLLRARDNGLLAPANADAEIAQQIAPFQGLPPLKRQLQFQQVLPLQEFWERNGFDVMVGIEANRNRRHGRTVPTDFGLIRTFQCKQATVCLYLAPDAESQ